MEIMIFSLGYDCGMIQYLTKQLFPTMLIFMLFGSSKENYTCLKILSSRYPINMQEKKHYSTE